MRHGQGIRLFILFLLASTLGACGTATTETSIFDPATGRHTPADWRTSHPLRYGENQASCQGCHGGDLKGGTSGVSCDRCHRLPHPHPYLTHYTAETACSPCHGTAYEGGNRAPACSSCHQGLTIGTAPVRGECISCHGKSAGPDGNRFPNRSGSHRIHLSHGVFGCDVCHSGAGSGTDGHGYRQAAAVSLSPPVNGKRGVASWSSARRSCSNVSCHGGMETPAWGIGHINSRTVCTSCHSQGTSETNGYWSGKHSLHIQQQGLACIDCHDTEKLFRTASPNHFSNLTTARFELSPASTIRDALNYANQTCSPSAGSTRFTGVTVFTTGCHGTERWQ